MLMVKAMMISFLTVSQSTNAEAYSLECVLYENSNNSGRESVLSLITYSFEVSLVFVVVLLLNLWCAQLNLTTTEVAVRKVGQSNYHPIMQNNLFHQDAATTQSVCEGKKHGIHVTAGYSQIFTEQQLVTTACCRLRFYYTMMNLDIQLYAPANRVCSATPQRNAESSI
ncbi:conserved hypothetical protein [Trichinella spiralis]|uniref:hypothetical protein n=1 Tax=Trichinella spiralis TaxID=6334 RepID=UPI0001EFBF83|nr:conserved hypothetical protein [Trichinella spiralis]